MMRDLLNFDRTIGRLLSPSGKKAIGGYARHANNSSSPVACALTSSRFFHHLGLRIGLSLD